MPRFLSVGGSEKPDGRRFLSVGGSEKPDGSILSEADLAAQAAFADGLRRIIDCPMLGEEMSEQRQRDLWLHNYEGLWVVDPIDGTTNFVNGFPHFALSVAFMRHGRPELAVIYDPVARECFSASSGGGAYLNGRRLPLLRQEKKLHRILMVAGCRWSGRKKNCTAHLPVWKSNICVRANFPAA